VKYKSLAPLCFFSLRSKPNDKDSCDQIIRWINNAIPLLTDKRAKDRVLKLQATEADIGKYLYVSGRCAVAHASSDPVVDPDNPDAGRASARFSDFGYRIFPWVLGGVCAPP